MEYIIVSYRSRAHTIKFHEILRRNGIYSEIVNTPKEANVGCGLSVRISKERFVLAKKIVHMLKLNSFAGFFICKTEAGKKVIRTI